MPVRHELLSKHQNDKARQQMRAFQEAAVIAALPDDLLVRRAYTTTEQANNRKIAAAHGIWELDVENYEALVPLAARQQLSPVGAVRVVKDDGTFKSTSFYPAARIPPKWWERDDMTIDNVEPYIWQGAPIGGHNDCAVTVEWFCEPRTGQFINVRANVLIHDCRYAPISGAQKWVLKNAPSGNVRKTGLYSDGRPSYVTVWWWNGTFTEDEYTAFDLLTERRAVQDA